MTGVLHPALSSCRKGGKDQCSAAPQVGGRESRTMQAALRQRADGKHPPGPFCPPAQPLKALCAAEALLEDDVLDAALSRYWKFWNKWAAP